MTLTQPREGRQRRRASRQEVAPSTPCAVSGCLQAGATVCAGCARSVCRRHAGAPSRAKRSANGAAGAVTRCALCRLDERRRGQALVRRLWWGAAAAGFAVFTALAFHTNAKQGVALLALAAVIGVLAVGYDRALRRR
ncbi:MAG TPA: hypothetical protein VFD32_09420 [Dehalococcoidia bacterium]|nr:hypothetical protein [Dehalococcoidia bacterium]